MPKAYEAAVLEMKRRFIFRTGLDSHASKIKEIIQEEEAKRQNFINTHQ